MAQKKLTASEASIKTATIEVKILQIGNRQFTLSVFDQLTEEPIIDEDTGKLRGTPWGRVNRHTDCKEMSKLDAPHLHIIWQKGGELRRAVAAIPWEITHYVSHPEELPKYLACSYFRRKEARNLLALLWLKARVLAGERVNTGGNSPTIPFDIYGHKFEVEVDISSQMQLRAPAQSWNSQQMHNDLRKHVGTTNPTEVQAYLVKEIEEFSRFVPAWQKSYKQLERLDQLFIAV